jgi:hypothetical protein
MKLHTQRKTGHILFALLLAAGLQAQVVIGMGESPEEAALLQIKDTHAASPGGATATKGGLLLPRVALGDASDITVISSNVTDDKKKELTGLLVYNVNTAGELDEGIYEWDGDVWNQLEILSEIAGSSTQKAVVTASDTYTKTPTVSMGIFEFRINPTTDWKQMLPQYRLTVDTLGSVTFYYNVARHWDSNGDPDPNSTDGGFNATGGFSYDALSKNFAAGDNSTWKDFHSSGVPEENFRYDIWLIDHENNHAYNVQVLRAKYGFLTSLIHVLRVTEY